MKKILYLTLFFILTSFNLTGCIKKIEYKDVCEYSDFITTSILKSINDLDYTEFSSYLSNDMKESYDLACFQSETTNIINNLGTFESLEFYAGQEKNSYVYIIYDVYYSNFNESVPISITFKKDDPEHKVYELYFDSNIINK